MQLVVTRAASDLWSDRAARRVAALRLFEKEGEQSRAFSVQEAIVRAASRRAANGRPAGDVASVRHMMIGGGADRGAACRASLCLRVALLRVYNSLIENMSDEQMFGIRVILNGTGRDGTGGTFRLCGEPLVSSPRRAAPRRSAPRRAISEPNSGQPFKESVRAVRS